MRPLLQIPGRRSAVGPIFFSSDGTMGKRSRFAKMIVLAKSLIALLVSLDMAFIPVSAYARQFGDESPPEAAQELRQPEGAGTFKGTKIFANERVSIRRAIAIAETRVVGAKVVDVSIDEESDQIAYKIRAYQHNEIWTGTIDVSTGEIIGGGTITPAASLEEREKVELANFRASGMDLSEAVAVAEEYGMGSAISAGLEERNGKTIFVVVLVVDGRLREVAVEMVCPLV